MHAPFERSARNSPTTDYSHAVAVRLEQHDGSRVEYGFYRDSVAELTPAYVSRILRKPDGSWGPAEFWDARYDETPCPDIPDAAWRQARERLRATRRSPVLGFGLGAPLLGAAVLACGVLVYLL